jgi:hypothetical protein
MADWRTRLAGLVSRGRDNPFIRQELEVIGTAAHAGNRPAVLQGTRPTLLALLGCSR